MSKSILIIDTPEDCYGCNLCREDNQTYRPYCSIVYRDIFYTHEKPNWCPLKPIPKKIEGYDSIKQQWGEYEDGWNHCVDSILND